MFYSIIHMSHVQIERLAKIGASPAPEYPLDLSVYVYVGRV